MLARNDPLRNEDEKRQYLVCIDLFAWYNLSKQNGQEMIHDVIDISTESAQNRFFHKGKDAYRDAGSLHGIGAASQWEHLWGQCMRQAKAAQEVLLKWMGHGSQ